MVRSLTVLLLSKIVIVLLKTEESFYEKKTMSSTQMHVSKEIILFTV